MDESGQSTDRYMCVGGIVILEERLDEVRAGIARIKAAAGINSEVKWTNLRAHTLRHYKLMVEYFFTLIRTKQIHFHAVIVDFHQFNHKANGGRENSVSRMLFQLSLHTGCFRYGHRADLHLFPDSGDHANILRKHRYHLNNASRKAMPEGRGSAERPVVLIRPTDSASELMLQLNDLILGAISYRRNERWTRPGASRHKRLLSRAVAEYLDATTFHYNPKLFGRRFTIWNFRATELRKAGSRS